MAEHVPVDAKDPNVVAPPPMAAPAAPPIAAPAPAVAPPVVAEPSAAPRKAGFGILEWLVVVLFLAGAVLWVMQWLDLANWFVEFIDQFV
jgi:hypothetical protein